MQEISKKFILGITGATGSIYGFRLAHELINQGCEVHLIVTDAGRQVMEFELGKPFSILMNELLIASEQNATSALIIEDYKNFFSLVASGSYPTNGMVVAPCSMGTAGKIAAGTSDNLLIRAADVCLKEKRPVVLMVRETPLNAIHLENMLKLHRAGATIMPPMPSFYNKPTTLDDIVDQSVGRVLSMLGIETALHHQWGN